MPAQHQSYANHRRYVPMFHFVTGLLLLANLVFAIYHVIRVFGLASVVNLMTAFALVLLFLYTRAFAAANQDRIIRVEERLRMERLFPEPLKSRVPEFSVAQCVALRFASDGELPGLAQRVLEEKIDDRESIKKLIRDWRPDHDRV